jgi:AcrR family transcriptional regulator
MICDRSQEAQMITKEVDKAVIEELPENASKRGQILEGARRVFLAEGFDASSMGAIAREAGVSKGTLYVYFKNKEELFEAIVEDQCHQQAEQIFNFDSSAEIDVELRNVGKQFVRFLCRSERVSSLRTVIAIAERMPELGAKFYSLGPAHGIGKLRRYLDNKVAAGVLKPHDTEVAAAQFLDSCAALSFKRVLFNFAGPPSDLQIAHIVDMSVRTYLAAYG